MDPIRFETMAEPSLQTGVCLIRRLKFGARLFGSFHCERSCRFGDRREIRLFLKLTFR